MLLIVLISSLLGVSAATRSTQLWLGVDESNGWPSSLSTLAERTDSFSDIVPYELFTYSGATLILNETRGERSAEIVKLGFNVWPMLSGDITNLRDLMSSEEIIFGDSIELAKRHGWTGYNLDFELNINTTDGCNSDDAAMYKGWLDDWSLALQAVGLGLTIDVGGCNDPFPVDFCGMTCDDYRVSNLDRLITMSTYDNGNLTAFQYSLAQDTAALCNGTDCERYQAGIYVDTTHNELSDPAPVFSAIEEAGVSRVALWAGVPNDAWLDAFAEYLRG